MLFGVFATVGVLVAMHISDGMVALGACGALLAAVVGLWALTSFLRSQQKVAFTLEGESQGMLLRGTAGLALRASAAG